MLPLICIALTHHLAAPRASLPSRVRGRTPTACAPLAERRSLGFQGYETSYIRAGGPVTAGVPPVVLVHGFGGSSGQWRATISDLVAAGRAVYALDLLAFGSSAKPRIAYSIDLWADQLLHFIAEVVIARDGAQSAVVVGNSIGSLTALCAASRGSPAIAGVGLFNCAIGMNSKARPLPGCGRAEAIFLGWVAPPLFFLIDLLLRSPLGRVLFDRVRKPETVRRVLEGGVYVNTARVDDALVELITCPAEADGAFEAFVEILSGDPGPRPEILAPHLRPDLPVAVFWGTDDQVTPLGGPVGLFFQRLPDTRPGSTEFTLLPGTGHCPFDDRPDLCSPALLGWLQRTWPAEPGAATS